VRSDDAVSYLRRVLPYRTSDNRIDGVVIAWVDITRRLAAEAESRRLTAVLRDSNDAVVLLDLEGRIIGWNRGAAQLYGYAEADALKLCMQDLVPAPHRQGTSDLVGRISRGDIVSESLETQRQTKDGRTRDVSLTMTLLRDAAGRAEAIATTERDVTAIKENLAARQGALLYQQMIEHLPAGAVLRQGDNLIMNLEAERITGYQRGELATIDMWCSALHGDRAHTVRPHYEASGPPATVAQPFSLVITNKDGQPRHVDLAICRLDGAHALWMLIDMTDRDQAERARRLSEEYLRSIVTTAADAIITINEHGLVDSFNPSAERMFGYTAAEVIDQNVSLLMPSPYREEHDGYLSRYLASGEAHIIGTGREVIGRRKDGTMFPLALSVSEIGNFRHFTGILHDLSHRRELEWRLTEIQLEERRHIAQELHDDVGGHMTGIGLLAQTLQAQLTKAQSPLAGKSHELIVNIGEVHQKLRSAIRGLMPVEAMPEGLMVAIQELAKQSAAVHQLSCQFQCETPVHVDDPAVARHLFRIVQEAVNNAARHGKPTHITISLEQTGERLLIGVADDGRGIEETAPGHDGIGLESMRQRACLLGGDVSIRPRDGGGTVVTCWVPWPAATRDARAARREGQR
jgi:two-component system CheB/CheR fusion protein